MLYNTQNDIQGYKNIGICKDLHCTGRGWVWRGERRQGDQGEEKQEQNKHNT